jgi:DNA (cytosine-5)-methyltransferase 1
MYSILDTFSGCGGLSLGAHMAGFKTELSIDADAILSSSFPLNFPSAKLLQADIRQVGEKAIKAMLPNGVDGVIGGPPCQAFSEMGRRDTKDPRRDLVLEYFRIVQAVNPKFFVFENVRGLGFDENIGLLQTALERLPSKWKIIGPHILNAADFGAPTRRLRLFVFGFNKNEMTAPEEKELIKHVSVRTCVRDAIGDLVTAAEAGVDESGFDYWKYDNRRSVSKYARGMRTRSGQFTAHQKTKHTTSTLKRFADLSPGEVDRIGKYVRLSWDGLCPTLRAGTGSDKGSYQAVRPIHPLLDRVITPREAARLQGFPDKFLFHPTVWHSCRMIGNSVSPVIAKVLLERIKHSLDADVANSALIAAE